MNQELVGKLEAAQCSVEPRLKHLRQAVAALRKALRLATEEKADALPMRTALVKLEQAAAAVPDPELHDAIGSFRSETERALDALAFDFARDLR